MDEYPQYFGVDGTPARIMSARDLPEIYAGNGRWKLYDDRFKLISDATVLTAAKAQELAKQFDAMATA